MPSKETTYQRLKRENKELRQKLIILATAPNSEAGLVITGEIKLNLNIEAAIWAGDVNHKSDGLIKQIADA